MKAGGASFHDYNTFSARARDGGRSARLDAELAQDLGGVLAEPGHGS